MTPETTYADVEQEATAEARWRGDTYHCDECKGPLDGGSIRVGTRLLCGGCAHELSKEDGA